MNVLVTGGAGYIGSAAAVQLMAAGHQVTIFDNLSRGHRTAVPEGAAFVQGDLGDAKALEALFAGGAFEAVMHFAALIEAGESMQQPATYFRNNTVYSLNLIDAAVRHGAGRFVLSSTAAVFAGGDEPLAETSTIAPANVYGETKWMIERMLAWFSKQHGLHYAALRYFNASGALPGRGEAHRPESHLIPRVLAVALGRAPEVSIYGTDYPTPDGTCIRDYIHIADLVSAHLLALDALADQPELIYNLGNGTGYSVRQVIEVARAVSGHVIPAVERPRRPGDAPRLVASSEKIKRELGWTLQYAGLETIVASAWDWHHSHPNGYGDD